MKQISIEAQKALVDALEIVERQLPRSATTDKWVQGVVDLHGDEIAEIKMALARARGEMHDQRRDAK